MSRMPPPGLPSPIPKPSLPTPVPEEGIAYEVRQVGEGYRVTWPDTREQSRRELILAKDFSSRSVVRHGRDWADLVEPHFGHYAGKFLLTSYSYNMLNPVQLTTRRVQVDSQEVGGLMLPHHVQMIKDTGDPKTSTTTELVFSEYQVNKK